jgi:hypothetical protein
MHIINLDLLFESPQKDAEVIERKGVEASIWRSTMAVQNKL